MARSSLLILALLLLFLSSEARAQALCGDFLCACGSDENGESCPQDCGPCGDLVCDPYEDTESCPQDCGPCGDLICDGVENHGTCPADCPDLCGDLVCDPGEIDCPSDCGDSVVACGTEPGAPTPSPSPSDSPGPGPEDGDPDGDGIPNDGSDGTTDNCPDDSNPNQIDRDGDGIGDACDRTPTGGNLLDGAEFGGGGGCSLNPRL